jgi:hypothetical protein
MALSFNKYDYANFKRMFLRSRRVFAIIFAIFVAIGIALIIFSCNTNTQAFGISLLAGALISIATLWIEYIRTGEQVRADELLRSGLIGAYERRDLVEEYNEHVKGCKKISVAGYTLTAFTESNEHYFRQRAEKNDPVNVRMLLVDPESEWAKVMEMTEEKSPGAYLQAYQAIVSKMKGVDGVELRLLKRHLPMMIYTIDHVLYTGPYPHRGASRMATTLKLAGDGWLFQRQSTEFEELWATASMVSLTALKASQV